MSGKRKPRRTGLAAFLLMLVLTGASGSVLAQTGRELIESGLQRNALPAHVYAEHSLVMTDRHGRHTLRTGRVYQQHDAQASRLLWVIDTPAELKGSAILVVLERDNGLRRGAAANSSVFGSNFTVGDLEGEQPRDFDYEREDDQVIDRVPHFVVRAKPRSDEVARSTGYQARRLYLRKDNLFVSRIDYLDREGRPARRQSLRDPRADESGIWRAGMILMEDLRDRQRSLLKVERRVHSADYVPPAVFAGLAVSP